MISVVIPALNEAAGIERTLAGLQAWRERGHEILLVDGGSEDGTPTRAAPYVDAVLAAPKGRASQMNAGAAAARGDWLLFLHADSLLPPDALAQLRTAMRSDAGWGRFDVCLSGRHPLLRIVALLMNLRSAWTGIATGDQAMFVRRAWFDAVGGYARIPLMEDVALSRRLLERARPFLIRSPVATDSRRWEQKGIWRTIALMWRLRWQYWRGADPAVLAQRYYPASQRCSPPMDDSHSAFRQR